MPYFQRVPKEYSENEACFVFVNRGELSVRAPQDYLNLDHGSGVLAKCMNYFFEGDPRKQKTNPEGIEVIAVLLYPDMLEQIVDFELTVSPPAPGYEIKQVVINDLLENFKQSISLLLDHPELADETIIEAKIKEFVLLMTRSQELTDQNQFLSNLFSPLTLSFKATIQHNLFASLTLEELAKLTHMSLSSFKRKFREVYHESPQKYISRKKIEKAAQLLKLDQQRISDIAYDVGFESIATFNRNFTQYYGMSPSRYRLS